MSEGSVNRRDTAAAGSPLAEASAEEHEVLLDLAYHGKPFCGWQKQPNSRLPSVESSLEAALSQFFSGCDPAGEHDFAIRASGRTDAGVHARSQPVRIAIPEEISLFRLREGLNAILHRSIQCRRVANCPPGFDPRRSSHQKLYVYRIQNRRERDIHIDDFSLHVPQKLDVASMIRAAVFIEGSHDFSSFRVSDCTANHPVRTVLKSEIVRNGSSLLEYRVIGCGFLKQMVRSIVGTLIEVGLGKRSASEFAELIELRSREAAGKTAAARGLTLVSVVYEQDPFCSSSFQFPSI